MARFRLGLEGIHARLADEATVGWLWYYAVALGGVKVIVRPEDLPAALDILERERAAGAARRRCESAAEVPSEGPAASAGTAEEPTPESWICPKCREEVPGDWETCWACGTTIDGVEDVHFEAAGPVESPGAVDSECSTEQSADRAGGVPAPPRVPQTLPPAAPVRGRWPCSRCGARVPGDFTVCWACGTTADGQADPDFEVADAPIVEHDWDSPPSVWRPIVCFLCPPLFVYDLMFRLLPERPPQRFKRRVTFAPLDPRLVRACLLAVLAIGWFPPFALGSLWLLRKLDWGKGVQRQRTRTFFLLALALNLVWLGMILFALGVVSAMALFLENSGWAPG